MDFLSKKTTHVIKKTREKLEILPNLLVAPKHQKLRGRVGKGNATRKYLDSIKILKNLNMAK